MHKEIHELLTERGASDRLEGVAWWGHDLNRPECVLATARGDIYTADWRGGVSHILPDGSQRLYTGPAVDGEALKPNGIALLEDGSFLLAHLGAEKGGIFRLYRDGRLEPFLRAVDGCDLPPSNFVVQDAAGRTWITVSTRLFPRALGYRKSCNDGFVVLVDKQGARIVADGLGYTNECALDPTGQWLYVNETFTRELSRFAIRADSSLGAKEVVTRFDAGVFPDGLAFDTNGHAWVVSIVSNRLIRVAPDGAQTLWLEDADAEHLAWVEAAYQADEMGRPHLDGAKSRCLKNISSLAFGGPDLRTAYLGCLLGDRLATLPMPVAGHPPFHWNF
ncbi:MAG: SMP-30/gluconolactonase/LRE family protein [Polaromonas sp.]|nr:SMP-30/gluconolactonase/LRE family protein [Polaromonas sp.]MDP3355509.1 SMP-30/gluconolactonase/LRE family protein [Polaromonas sp.]MDP3752669.1 SMP-30/gluconolactonase/LRE family protein [Polaromonas sp.]